MAVTQHIVLAEKGSYTIHPPLSRQGVEEDVRIVINPQIGAVKSFCLVKMPSSISRIRVAINSFIQREHSTAFISKSLIKCPLAPCLG